MKPRAQKIILTLTLAASTLQTLNFIYGRRRDREAQRQIGEMMKSPAMQRLGACVASCSPLGDTGYEAPCMKVCVKVKEKHPEVDFDRLLPSCRLECALEQKIDPPGRDACISECALKVSAGGVFGNLSADPTDSGRKQGLDLVMAMYGPTALGKDTRITHLCSAGDRLIAAGPTLIFRSADGACFIPAMIDRKDGTGPIAGVASAGGVLYAALAHAFVQRSKDGGAHWTPAGKSPPTSRLDRTWGEPLEALVLARDGDRLLAATSEGIWTLGPDDRWTKAGSPTEVAVDFLFVAESGLALAASEATIFRSEDHLDSWTPIRGGPKPIDDPVRAAAASKDAVYLFTAGGKVYRSKDQGKVFAPVGRGLPRVQGAVTSAVMAGGDLFAATDGSGLFRSRDGGRTFAPADEGIPQEAPARSVHALIVDRGGKIFAGTDAGLFRSSDGGKSWRLGACRTASVAR